MLVVNGAAGRRLRVPADADTEGLRRDLEKIADDLMVDLTLALSYLDLVAPTMGLGTCWAICCSVPSDGACGGCCAAACANASAALLASTAPWAACLTAIPGAETDTGPSRSRNQTTP